MKKNVIYLIRVFKLFNSKKTLNCWYISNKISLKKSKKRKEKTKSLEIGGADVKKYCRSWIKTKITINYIR